MIHTRTNISPIELRILPYLNKLHFTQISTFLESFDRITREYTLAAKLATLQLDAISTCSNQRKACLEEQSGLKQIFCSYCSIRERTIYRQTLQIESHFEKLAESMASLDESVKEISELERLANLRAKVPSRLRSPADVHITTICDWLRRQLQDYKIDYYTKVAILEKVTLAGDNNIAEIIGEWDLEDKLDYRHQVMMMERLNISKLFL